MVAPPPSGAALAAYIDEKIKLGLDHLRGESRTTKDEVMGLISSNKLTSDGLLSRVTLLERSSAATGTSRRDNETSKREVKSLLTFGSQMGPTYEDWAADFTTALEQVCKEIVLITEWVDKQPTVESITEAEFKDMVARSGQNEIDMNWALSQLYYILADKLSDQVKDLLRGKNRRGQCAAPPLGNGCKRTQLD